MLASNSPIRLQLAVQGGGAKLPLLLAALEAVQELERDGLLHVTRLAGTSAGAIAACAFAADLDFSKLRRELQKVPATTVVAAFPRPSTLQFAWCAARGITIWDPRKVQRLLTQHFGTSKLRDLRVPVFVTATDLRDRKAYVSPHDTPVVHALMDSAGLPFYFRLSSNASGLPLVDGGICENLPSDTLQDGTSQYGPVVGITLRDDSVGSAPEGAVEFAGALLSTAIENSVERARRSLQSRLFCIDTNIGTFDFERGLTDGLSDKYDVVKMRASNYFHQLAVQLRASVSASLWEQSPEEILRTLGDIFRLQHQFEPFRIIRESLEVHAYSLREDRDPWVTVPDETRFTKIFEPSDRPLACIKMTLHSLLGSEFWGTFVSVTNVRGEQVDVRIVPLLDSAIKVNQREFLLFFTPPLLPDSNKADGPYELVVQDRIKDAMSELREGRPDYVFLGAKRTDQPVEELDLVVAIPATFRSVRLIAEPVALTGHALSRAELKRYPAPAGFRCTGWRFYNVSASTLCRLNLHPDEFSSG